jgi:hypothetical protein
MHGIMEVAVDNSLDQVPFGSVELAENPEPLPSIFHLRNLKNVEKAAISCVF